MRNVIILKSWLKINCFSSSLLMPMLKPVKDMMKLLTLQTLMLPYRNSPRVVADDKLRAQQHSLPIASVMKTQNPSWVVQQERRVVVRSKSQKKMKISAL